MRRVERDKETEAGSLAPRALLLIWRRTSALEMWSGTPMLLLMYLQNIRILSSSVARCSLQTYTSSPRALLLIWRRTSALVWHSSLEHHALAAWCLNLRPSRFKAWTLRLEQILSTSTFAHTPRAEVLSPMLQELVQRMAEDGNSCSSLWRPTSTFAHTPRPETLGLEQILSTSSQPGGLGRNGRGSRQFQSCCQFQSSRSFFRRLLRSLQGPFFRDLFLADISFVPLVSRKRPELRPERITW